MLTQNIVKDLLSQDIFQQDAQRRAKQLYDALFARRASLNERKSKLLKSNYRFKRTDAYANQLENVKDAITFLTQRINMVSVMREKNSIDLEALKDIEAEYNSQVV